MKNWNGRARARALVLVAAVTGLLLSSTASSWAEYHGPWQSVAWANDGSRPDVIGDCNQNDGGMKPDSCTYHETNSFTQLGYIHQVSNIHDNCGSAASTSETVTQTYTVSSSYSWGTSTSTTTSIGGELKKGLTFGVDSSTTSSQTWEVGSSATTSRSVTINIPARTKAALYFQPYIHKSQGWLEIHYPKKNHDHYIWYYPSQGGKAITVSLAVKRSDGTAAGIYSTKTLSC